MSTLLVFGLLLFGLPLSTFAAQASGDAIYQKRCAACHEQLTPRIPHREVLQKMPAARILRTLDSGAMMSIAFVMSRDERRSVASYLGTPDTIAAPGRSAFCASPAVTIAANPSGWNGWSPGTSNARFQPVDQAGLTIDRVRRLTLKWAFGFEGDVTAYAQPTVLDGHLFVGSAGGTVQAMRADSGCLEWTFQANGPVRTAITAAPLGNRHALLFGDMTGWFYAVAAETGKLLWKLRLDEHDSARLTGAATADNGVVYVPLASLEETRSADPEYVCCTFRGSVAALRIRDGRLLWKTYMVGVPRETGKNARGLPMMGPSGVGVWSAPTVDAKRNLVYVTTGDNYSHPATELSDAVVALDLASGRIVWSKQVTAGDIFNGSCRGDKLNCPGEAGPDFDFGSSAIPVTLPGEKICSWRGRNPASCTRSIRTRRARSCGRPASAKAAPTAACNGACPPTAVWSTRRFPIPGRRARTASSIPGDLSWIRGKAAA